MVRKIKLAPFGWTSRLAAAVLMTVMGLQSCGASAEKAEVRESRAEDLVNIEIMITDGEYGPACGKKGFINTKGEMVIPPRFAYCRRYLSTYDLGGQNFTSNGLAAITETGETWGYINTRGEMVIPAKFQMVEKFTANGLALVKENGKFGYINTKGEMAIPAIFRSAGSFGSNGLAFVLDDEGQCFINAQGEVVLRSNFGIRVNPRNTSFAANGLAAVRVDPITSKEYVYINLKGKMVIDRLFFRPGVFADNGLAAVVKYSKVFKDSQHYGYVNSQGEMVIPVRFSFASTFAANGLAAVTENGKKWGYINAKGKMVIPTRFSDAKSFAANGLAAIRNKNMEWGYINAKGVMVINPRFDEAEGFSSNGVARVKENGKVSYINETGQVIAYIDEMDGRKVVKNARDEVIWSGDKAETQELKVNDLAGIEIMVTNDGDGRICGKKGFINTQGEMVIPPRFAYCRRPMYPLYDSYDFGGQNFTSNGLAAVTENGKKWGYINTKGEMVIPARFKRVSPAFNS